MACHAETSPLNWSTARIVGTMTDQEFDNSSNMSLIPISNSSFFAQLQMTVQFRTVILVRVGLKQEFVTKVKQFASGERQKRRYSSRNLQ